MRKLSVRGIILISFLCYFPFSVTAEPSNTSDLFVSSARLHQKHPELLCPKDKTAKKSLINEVDEYAEDVQATIEAMQIWEAPNPISKLDQLSLRIRQIRQSLKDDSKSGRLCDLDKIQKSTQSLLLSRLGEVDAINIEAQQWISSRKQVHQQRARDFNERMHFRYGLSYFLDPREKLLQWSLFNSGLFRLNSTFPNKSRKNDPLDEKGRANVAMDVLRDADRYGYKAILMVTAGGHPSDISEISFTDSLIPSLRRSFHRFNFNSSQRRIRIKNGLRTWGGETQSASNIITYQLFNEPFWSAKPDKVYSYDPGTIGCSEDVWRKRIRERYPTFKDWIEAIPITATKTRRILGGKNITDFIPWRSFDEMSYGNNAFAGLSFVSFLKKKYPDIHTLNKQWFGDDYNRYFHNWTDVFPPFPESNFLRDKIRDTKQFRKNISTSKDAADIPLDWIDNNLALPKPAKHDIPGWIDWTQYWAFAINDELLDFRQAMIDGGARAPIGSNTIGGHFINGFNNVAVDTGMNPWETPSGLDTLSIDFYSTGYLPYYIRALRGTANGRPIIIHETELYNGTRGAYAILFAFAHGADALSFWRRDEELPPRYAIHLMKAMRAMNNFELQKNSQPISDSVSIIYSLDSLRLSDAIHGGPTPYLKSFQGAALALEKMQFLFDISEASKLNESKSKLLILPGINSLSNANILALNKHLNNGTKLIITSELGKYDTHGTTRRKNDLFSIINHPNTYILPEDFFSDLRSSLSGNDHDPRLLFELEKTTKLNSLTNHINSLIKKELSYIKQDGSIASAHPGARRGASGDLFVFVDPWQHGISIEARGKYSHALDISSAKYLNVQHTPEFTRINDVHGPTVIQFRNRSPGNPTLN